MKPLIRRELAFTRIALFLSASLVLRASSYYRGSSFWQRDYSIEVSFIVLSFLIKENATTEELYKDYRVYVTFFLLIIWQIRHHLPFLAFLP